MRHATVTLTLREEDARWLYQAHILERLIVPGGPNELDVVDRIEDELKHALAECDCGEETR